MSLEAIWKLIVQMLLDSRVTLGLFALTALFALPLGLLVACGRMSRLKLIQWPVRAYLLVMRGTPLILQLIFFYFMPSYIFGQSLPRFWAAVLAFTLNYAAYFAEIYRGGIEAVAVGQREAAAVLGFSRSQTFGRIVLPQVVKHILPPMGNEFMVLVKDTALAQTIGVMEIFRLANTTVSANASLVPIFIAGVFYLVMNAIVSKGFSIAEKRLDYYK
ncbi:MAG: amino acid ABC transporter permease [Clostridiales bacterium]|nr:amino acid ABC transporter permease [Clostridiales bacterium]